MSSWSNGNEIYHLSSIFQIGNNLTVAIGWIGAQNCSSECPSNCKEKTWEYWKGKTADGTASLGWSFDPTIQVAGKDANENFEICLDITFQFIDIIISLKILAMTS